MKMKRTEILFILTNFINIYGITHKKSNKFFSRKSQSISFFIISKSLIFGNTAMKAYMKCEQEFLSTIKVSKT